MPILKTKQPNYSRTKKALQEQKKKILRDVTRNINQLHRISRMPGEADVDRIREMYMTSQHVTTELSRIKDEEV